MKPVSPRGQSKAGVDLDSGGPDVAAAPIGFADGKLLIDAATLEGIEALVEYIAELLQVESLGTAPILPFEERTHTVFRLMRHNRCLPSAARRYEHDHLWLLREYRSIAGRRLKRSAILAASSSARRTELS